MKYRNLYIHELDNNANAIITPAKTTYCVKCGKKLNENSLDRFCDSECRKEYFAEIRKDIDSLEIYREHTQWEIHNKKEQYKKCQLPHPIENLTEL